MLSAQQGVRLTMAGALLLIVGLICVYVFGVGNVPLFIPELWTLYSWFLVIALGAGALLVFVAMACTETKPHWLKEELRDIRLKARSRDLKLSGLGIPLERSKVGDALDGIRADLDSDRGCGTVAELYDECQTLLLEADKLIITGGSEQSNWRYVEGIFDAIWRRVHEAEEQLRLLRGRVVEA